MSYRTLYIVCYDICSPRRLQRVHRYLQGFRVGGQKSFFECWLTPPELRSVRNTLNELIENESDRVHILQIDPRMQPQCLGRASTKPLNSPFFVL